MNTRIAIKNLQILQKKKFFYFMRGHIKYLKDNVLASIVSLENTRSKKVKLLLSNALMEVGQFYEITLSKPSLAIPYYKKSLVYNPLNSRAEWYLADCYQDLGKLKLAIKNYRLAIKIDNNLNSPYILKSILECKEKLGSKKTSYNYYNNDSAEYIAEKYLATFAPNRAIEILRRKKKKNFKLININILGYLNLHDEYIKAWVNFFEKGETVYLDTSNWYYMPISVYKNKRIWEIFLKYHKLIENSCFIQFESLSKYGYVNKSLKIQKIICQFMVYKLKGNLQGLIRLQNKFPKWKEVKIEIKKIHARSLTR